MSDSRYKVVVLGDSSVGKSTLIASLTSRSYGKTYIAPEGTPGCNVELMRFDNPTPNGTNAEIFELWDINGASIHRRAAQLAYIYDVHGVILVHDLANSRSEENLQQWVDMLKPNMPQVYMDLEPLTEISHAEYKSPLPILVVASRYDNCPERARNSHTFTDAGGLQFNLALDCRRPLVKNSKEQLTFFKFCSAVVARGTGSGSSSRAPSHRFGVRLRQHQSESTNLLM